MRDLDLWAVRCLVVLAEERHFGRAAKRLHLSQPGLSRIITATEARVGTTLVVHYSRPLRLTRDGNTLVIYGRRLLDVQHEAFLGLGPTHDVGRDESPARPRQSSASHDVLAAATAPSTRRGPAASRTRGLRSAPQSGARTG
jgi:hypothetical protein